MLLCTIKDLRLSFNLQICLYLIFDGKSHPSWNVHYYLVRYLQEIRIDLYPGDLTLDLYPGDPKIVCFFKRSFAYKLPRGLSLSRNPNGFPIVKEYDI